MNPLLRLSPEVADALAARQPVVALESTLIAHGLPRPLNLQVAQELEALVRAAGAVPATIAVADGRLRVGLETELLERLASSDDVAKVSRRDLPAVLASGDLGATTVAGTMIAAGMAGIRLFATGGIGGVHRGAELSFDVSADLDELARTPVAVVSAGVKAILDLPKTLEVLETRGVPVIGYRTDRLPAFFCRTSDLPLPTRCETPAEVANLLSFQQRLGYPGGTLIANPLPEDAALPEAEIEAALARALDGAVQQGITGKALTPFLLARIVEATVGRSLVANRALVEANAALAASIAVALSALSRANEAPKAAMRTRSVGAPGRILG